MDIDVFISGATRGPVGYLTQPEIDFVQSARNAAVEAENNAAEAAEDAALYAAAGEAFISGRLFDTDAEGLTKGVTAIVNVVAGAGGTDGTFDLAFTGGDGVGAAGQFVVNGGEVTDVILTHTGKNYTAAPAISFAASAGLAGASATAVVAPLIAEGAPYLVKGAAETFATLYKKVAGAAVSQGIAIASMLALTNTLTDAQEIADAAVAELAEYKQAAKLAQPKMGWIKPTDYVNVQYRNDYGVEFFSNGLKVWPMMLDNYLVRDEWRHPSIRVREPVSGNYYVAVYMGEVKDPVKQGNPVVTYYVNGDTGNDGTGTGAVGAPWKTMTKAYAVINAAAELVFKVIFQHTSWIGFGDGFNFGVYTLADNKQVTIEFQNINGEKPYWLPLMRRSITKAMFAWTNMGNGIWKSTIVAPTIPDAVGSTPFVFDLSVLDEEGAPTPSKYLDGPFADEAAILAAMAAAGPSWHTTAGNVKYVKLASGAEPDPGVNYAYAELTAANTFNLGLGARLCLRNVRVLHNNRVASVDTIYARPTTITLGPTQPNPETDTEFTCIDVEVYGSSKNAFHTHDVRRSIYYNCRDAYSWIDGCSNSSFYTYPANSNSPNEGQMQHMWVENHVSRAHGPNGFRNQPAVNNSANGLTGHSRAWTTALNSIFLGSNGGNVAYVGGAKAMLINCNVAGAKYVPPATSIAQANFLVHGAAAGDANDGTALYALFCTGMIQPTTGVMFYAEGAQAKLIAVEFKGVRTKTILNAALNQDGYGAAL